MFTGIIESLGRVESIHYQGNNFIYSINSPISKDLKIDQSVSHNGVCLTVVEIKDDSHTVVAINETLDKTNLKSSQAGASRIIHIHGWLGTNIHFAGVGALQKACAVQ